MTDWIALMEDHWAWLVFAALLGIGEVLILLVMPSCMRRAFRRT